MRIRPEALRWGIIFQPYLRYMGCLTGTKQDRMAVNMMMPIIMIALINRGVTRIRSEA